MKRPSETLIQTAFYLIGQLFVVLTEIFPFFNDFTVRQVAHAVFVAVFVFFDFGLSALFDAELGSRIGHADVGGFLFFRSGAGSQSSGGSEAEDKGFDHDVSFI